MKQLLTCLSYLIAMVVTFVIGSAVLVSVLNRYGEIDITSFFLGLIISASCYHAAFKALMAEWK